MNDIAYLAKHFKRKEERTPPLRRSIDIDVEGGVLNLYYDKQLIACFENIDESTNKMTIYGDLTKETPTGKHILKNREDSL